MFNTALPLPEPIPGMVPVPIQDKMLMLGAMPTPAPRLVPLEDIPLRMDAQAILPQSLLVLHSRRYTKNLLLDRLTNFLR